MAIGDDLIDPSTGMIKRNLVGVEHGLAVDNPVGVDIGDLDGAGEVMSPEFAASMKMDGLAGANKSAGGLFSGSNIGGTMQGIGAIAQAAAGIYDAHNKKKYQDKVFAMEEKRVARETERQDKQQANYEKVFG